MSFWANSAFSTLSSIYFFKSLLDCMNVFDDSNSVTLQVDDAVLDKSLTHRSFMTNREIVTKPLSSEQATDSRDAFVKVTTSSHHTVQSFYQEEEEKKLTLKHLNNRVYTINIHAS